jgi:hypothetical protein
MSGVFTFSMFCLFNLIEFLTLIHRGELHCSMLTVSWFSVGLRFLVWVVFIGLKSVVVYSPDLQLDTVTGQPCKRREAYSSA